MIHTLESDRLLLRPLTLEDAESLQIILGDPVAMEFYPQTWDLEGARDWIERNAQRYERDGHGLLAVTARGTGEFLGCCGLLKQEIDSEEHREVAYLLQRRHWGRGYASEAARRVRDEGFARYAAPWLISIIHPGNQPSIRVAERNGMQLWKRAPFRHLEQALIYRVDRPEGSP